MLPGSSDTHSAESARYARHALLSDRVRALGAVPVEATHCMVEVGLRLIRVAHERSPLGKRTYLPSGTGQRSQRLVA
jgi:hypothetical protein